MIKPDLSPDNEKSFARYIYSDLREEQKFLQRAMFTVLGLLALALGYLFKKPDVANTNLGSNYLLASQLLWIASMLELLLFSDYIFKTKFLIELELLFDPSQINDKPRPPLWKYWVKKNEYTKFSAYTVAVASLAFWTAAILFWLWYKIVSIENHSFLINWILLPLEIIIAIIATIKLCFEILRAGDKPN